MSDDEFESPGESSSPDEAARALSRALREGDHAAAAAALSRLEALYGLPTGPGSGEVGAGPSPGPGQGPGTEAGKRTESGPRAGPGGRRGGGLTDDGEFVPFYFTDPDRARAYAEEHGFVPAHSEAVPTRHAGPSSPLRHALEEGYAGVVIDPGSPHPAVLTPEAIREVLEQEGPQERTGPLEQEARSSDGATVGSTAPPPPHLLDLEQRVRRSPRLEPVPPPDTPPAQARELVQELRELQMEDRIPVWEVVDTLAFQVGFFVPVAPDPAHGLRWPLVVRHPRDPELPSVWIFTDPDEAQRALEPLPGEIETVHLSGLEAFRWIWAVPTPVREVVVDLYPDSPPPLFVPDTWMLGALYPHFMDCPELRAVERVPLAEIGELPGARGTKPECVRALVEGWPRLERSVHGSTDSSETVRHDGARYLPVTSRKSPRGGEGDGGGESGGPGVPAESGGSETATPPFRGWLRESVDCAGVLLNPDGPAPLSLDQTDLAVLALWSETGEQPDGTDLAGLVDELREELGASVAGRILADWPRYYWALQAGDGSGGHGEDAEDRATRAMTLPDRDTCPVFTSEEAIRRFLEDCRDRGLVGSGMQALVYLSGWAFNVFREIHVRYREGGWVNPDTAPPTEGMEMDPEMVRSALARIELRLQPRIPGFLPNP